MSKNLSSLLYRRGGGRGGLERLHDRQKMDVDILNNLQYDAGIIESMAFIVNVN